jgi:hypothetical protein
MLEICIHTSYDQNVQLILKSYIPVVYDTPLNRGGQFYWRGTRKKQTTCRKSLTITELLSQSIMNLYRHVILTCYTRVYANNRSWCIYQRYIHMSIRISIACVYVNHIYEKQIKMCGYAKYRSTCAYERQYGSAVWYSHSLMYSKDWISIRFSSFRFSHCIRSWIVRHRIV